MATQPRYQDEAWGQSRASSGTENKLATGLGWFSIGLGLAEVLMPGAMANLIGVEDEGRSRTVLRLYGLRELAAGIGILAQEDPGPWLWARVGGDLLDLSTLGKALASSDTERGKAIAATAAVLGVSALDLYCAQQFRQEARDGGGTQRESPHIMRSITIARSPAEVYGFWRDFSRLPQIFRQLESVQEIGQNRTHWKLNGPMGRTLEWDAETTEDEPNSRIAWRSLSSIAPHTGSVRFERATGNRGTKVTVQIQIGMVGTTLGKLFGAAPEQVVGVAIHNLKQLLEVGEIVQSDASIHTGMHAAQPPESYQAESRSTQATA